MICKNIFKWTQALFFFWHTVIWFQVFQPNTNNCLLLIICLHTVKWLQVLLCNSKNFTSVISLHTFNFPSVLQCLNPISQKSYQQQICHHKLFSPPFWFHTSLHYVSMDRQWCFSQVPRGFQVLQHRPHPKQPSWTRFYISNFHTSSPSLHTVLMRNLTPRALKYCFKFLKNVLLMVFTIFRQ